MSPELGNRKSSGDVVQGGALLILEYLRKQNRPYSANDVSMNLQNGVTKAYASKALKELHHSKKIAGRTSGKQTIYHALQEGPDDAMSGTMAVTDKETQELRQQLDRLKEDEKRAHAELLALSTRPLLCELRRDIDQLEKEIESTLTHLSRNGELDSGGMPQESLADVSRDWRLWQRHANTRRRICFDLWQRCSEDIPGDMSRDELWVRIISPASNSMGTLTQARRNP
ncbi:TBPIP-domain-containing protein [Aspergillus steynii IBT 23096]|uniref:TBPIP-domain-containing protein n=1 Tax=Aspergillus steynii IBT 23096 TaxID=1392250 RepID=A0A2I2GFU4_9EURO|nr:TBPIP-domain-containing protein [Aspergillus steynii IBT 23096]PLB51740.1 TBPIP-domain-containing protein [Aspergillus steynii IBT 23096]